MQKLSVLLVDRDIDTRMRLRHAVSTVEQFGETIQVNNLDDARGRLDRDNLLFDIVVVSYDFPRELITKFVQEGKDRRAGEDAAFIMVFPGNENKDVRIAEGLLAGVDGFLFEPFSVDELVSITELAAKIKEKRAVEREMMSIKYILKDVVRLIDVYSRLTVMNCDTKKVSTRLSAIHERLQAFAPEAQAAYLEATVEMFCLQPTPDPIFQRYKNLDTRSHRLKRKLAECLTDGVEQQRKEREQVARRLPPRKEISKAH